MFFFTLQLIKIIVKNIFFII